MLTLSKSLNSWPYKYDRISLNEALAELNLMGLT